MNKATLFIILLIGIQVSAQVKPKSSPSVDPFLVKTIPNQPRFYITIHGGYAVALGSTFKFYPDDVRAIRVEKINGSPESKQVEYESTKKGLGEGYRVGAGISYVLNDFINVGLDFDYFQSSIQKNRDSSYYESQSNNNSMLTEKIYQERLNTSYKTSLLTFIPNISFKAISRPKFFIYNKVGIVLTFRPNSLQKESFNGVQRLGWQGFYQDSTFSSEAKYDWGIRNPSLGFMGAVGTQIKIFEKVRGFAELQFSHILFRVKSRSLTSIKVDGNEMVNSLTVREREIEFSKNYVDNQSDNSPDEPMRAVTQRFPISYVGLQIGVAYRF